MINVLLLQIMRGQEGRLGTGSFVLGFAWGEWGNLKQKQVKYFHKNTVTSSVKDFYINDEYS